MQSKVALIFPPQWDPRQPPLCIPAIAGHLKYFGHDVRAWDLNLNVYRHALSSPKSKKLLSGYLSPSTLNDLKTFNKINRALEKVLLSTYAEYEEWLFWDDYTGKLSPDRSHDWKKAATNPEALPLILTLLPALSDLIAWKPDIISISSIGDTQIIPSVALSSVIRRAAPDSQIILGGHGFAYRRSLIKKVPWIFDLVDGICTFDGEPTLEALAGGEPLHKIPNLVIRRNGNLLCRTSVKCAAFSRYKEPDFSVLPVQDYLSGQIVIPIETARGCYWGKCTFCNHSRKAFPPASQYMKRSLPSIQVELKKHIKNGYHNFCFVDEGISKERLKRLSTMIQSIQKKIRWICYIRFDNNHTYDSFRMIKEAGCVKLFCGFETGSLKLLTCVRKGTNPSQIERIAKEASMAGLFLHFFIMERFPNEKKKDLVLTIDCLKKIVPFLNQEGFSYDIFPFSIELDTEMYHHYREFGIRCLKQPKKDDMAWRFTFTQRPQKTIAFENGKKTIDTFLKQYLNNQNGISQINLTQDSLHLLLLR